MDNWFPKLPLKSAAIALLSDLPRFETARTAEYEVDQAIGALRRHGGRTQRRLADKLDGCMSSRPCKSYACRKCMRWVRLWWVYRGIMILDPYRKKGLCKVTFIPADTAAPDELHGFDLESFANEMHRQIRQATKGLIVIGAVDFSANEHAGKEWNPHWKPHVTMLVGGIGKKGLVKKLEKLPRGQGDGMHHLVYVTAVTNLPSALTYCFKSSFNRCITFDTKRRKFKPALKPNQLAELLPVLDHAGFDNRVILCRISRQGNCLIDRLER